MNSWYGRGITSLCTASGLVLAIGMTPFSMTKIQKRFVAITGAAMGMMIGIAYNMKGTPLLKT
jgi:hypothetical protein